MANIHALKPKGTLADLKITHSDGRTVSNVYRSVRDVQIALAAAYKAYDDGEITNFVITYHRNFPRSLKEVEQMGKFSFPS